MAPSTGIRIFFQNGDLRRFQFSIVSQYVWTWPEQNVLNYRHTAILTP